jgi:glycine cleavage system aminomethyltransferase T
MASGEPFGMEISSTRAMTIRRIEGGILGNITDIDTSMTPFEAGLGQFVDLGKGDFIGCEALLTKDKKPLLFGLTCETETPTSGSIIMSNGDNVGHITAGVPSPTLGVGIGYARFLEPKNWPGSHVSICLPDKTVHPAKVVSLPFFDPEKKIVRGLDRTIP